MAKWAPSIFRSSQKPAFITSCPRPEVHRGNSFLRHCCGGARSSRHSTHACVFRRLHWWRLFSDTSLLPECWSPLHWNKYCSLAPQFSKRQGFLSTCHPRQAYHNFPLHLSCPCGWLSLDNSLCQTKTTPFSPVPICHEVPCWCS